MTSDPPYRDRAQSSTPLSAGSLRFGARVVAFASQDFARRQHRRRSHIVRSERISSPCRAFAPEGVRPVVKHQRHHSFLVRSELIEPTRLAAKRQPSGRAGAEPRFRILSDMIAGPGSMRCADQRVPPRPARV